MSTFVHHRIDAAPRQWQAVADRLSGDGARGIAEAGGQLYGAWRSQIGRPRDEVQAISVRRNRSNSRVFEQGLSDTANPWKVTIKDLSESETLLRFNGYSI